MATETDRTRNFASIVYKESAPYDFFSILESTYISSAISPYHDKDTEDDGSLKKPHWHILICFDSVKTTRQAREVFKLIGGVGCELINSPRGYSRYFCHLDNPEKFQYDINDVQSFNGFDYFSMVSKSIDRYRILSDIIDYCEITNTISFAQLLNYSRSYQYEWFKYLADTGTFVVKEYLKSAYWTRDIRKSHTTTKKSVEKNIKIIDK